MSAFQRYAVYYLPDDPKLQRFGAEWLGWDVETGEPVAHLDAGVQLEEITATPRKYGFHGTLKPPFRLAEGTRRADLETAVAAIAATAPPVKVAGLVPATVGSFLALVPTGDTGPLGALAARLVTELDGFRAPATPAELTRRRRPGLSERQDALLLAWGYPYVLDEFRFHITLTGALAPGTLEAAGKEAARLLPDLPRPFTLGSIALSGERPDGMFQTLHRYALSG